MRISEVCYMSEKKPRLGDLLLETGVLAKEQLEKALALQKKRQLRLGTILLQEAFVSEAQLVQALSRRLSIPWVNLWHIDIEDDLLELVPASVAEEFFLIPIYIRTTGNGERALYVAMNDPTDDSALRFVAAASGMSVKPMIAAPSDISAAIRAYYYGEEEPSYLPGPAQKPPPVTANQQTQGRGTAVPPPPTAVAQKNDKSMPPLPPTPATQAQESAEQAKPPAPPPEVAPKPPEKGVANQQEISAQDESPPAPKDTSEEALSAHNGKEDYSELRVSSPPKIPEAAKGATGDKSKAQREVEKHMFGVGGTRGKGISLTLLDGTTIDFGGAAQKKQAKQETLDQELFLELLTAAADGSPMDSRMPSEKWQHYMTALIKILFKKHLLFYNEYLNEIKTLSEE